jgi:beta-lactamase class A
VSNQLIAMNKIFLYLLLLISINLNAQKTDHHLQQQIENLVKDFHGKIGIYVHDLSKNKIVELNADTIFPTASIVKIPILMGIMHKIKTGELKYHQRLKYTDSLYYSEGDDILSSFKNGSEIELSKVMMLMLTISDNCASLWLQGLAGGGKSINQILDSTGFKDTRVNSRTTGREFNRNAYGWGQTTPREIANIMDRIVKNKLLGKAADEKMLRLLGRQYWDEEALSQIPPGVFTADKNGAVNESRDEIVYVNGKHPYILSIFTKNIKDQSWETNNETWVLTRKISALVWKYYHPSTEWEAPEVN